MSNQKVRRFGAAVGVVVLALGVAQVISGAGVQAGAGYGWDWGVGRPTQPRSQP
jgi:hypothetical protein